MYRFFKQVLVSVKKLCLSPFLGEGVIAIQHFLDLRVIGQTILHMQIETDCRQVFVFDGFLCQCCDNTDYVLIGTALHTVVLESLVDFFPCGRYDFFLG